MQSSSFIGLIGWIVLTFLAPLAGLRARPDAWYRHLNKPTWNPPPWIFGPVWTILYLLMATAAWLVWTRGGWSVQAIPLTFYLVQLILKAVWTPLFFGAHKPGWAMIDLAFMWLATLSTLVTFANVTPVAGWLLAPYLAWISFASMLNFKIWQLNS